VSQVAVRAVAGAAAVVVLTAAASACTKGSDPERVATTTMTTVAAPESTKRATCEIAVPQAWQKAIEDSAVDTGGLSNVPIAVGRRGEVAVSSDSGDTRGLLLIGADRSVTEIYDVAEPDQNSVGTVSMDDRWVVVGVQHAPRNANGVIPTLTRIDVVDRQGGPIRNVAESPREDLESGGKTIDSVALFGGKVYWITRDTYSGNVGKIQSYDLNTGAVTDVASGEMGNVRATAAGLAWDVAWDENTGPRAELKIPDALPPEVAGAIGTGRDQFTLTTDGNAYAWLTESAQGDPGLAYWSPNAGLLSVAGKIPSGGKSAVDLHVVGPYVVFDRGSADDTVETAATVVDIRSGALTYLRPPVGGADGGTIAVGLGTTGKEPPTNTGVVRVDALPPLSC
jgi:hypothetical protein